MQNKNAQFLAVAAYGWARHAVRTTAERNAKKNVPTFVKDRRVFTVLLVTPNDEGEYPWVDDMGMLRVPDGSTWETVYERETK